MIYKLSTQRGVDPEGNPYFSVKMYGPYEGNQIAADAVQYGVWWLPTTPKEQVKQSLYEMVLNVATELGEDNG